VRVRTSGTSPKRKPARRRREHGCDRVCDERPVPPDFAGGRLRSYVIDACLGPMRSCIANAHRRINPQAVTPAPLASLDGRTRRSRVVGRRRRSLPGGAGARGGREPASQLVGGASAVVDFREAVGWPMGRVVRAVRLRTCWGRCASVSHARPGAASCVCTSELELAVWARAVTRLPAGVWWRGRLDTHFRVMWCSSRGVSRPVLPARGEGCARAPPG